MYKMIVVDDSEMTRQGIRASVNWEVMDVRIVGEAADGLEAMVLIHDTDPDIIICDIRMPKLDGIALINEVLPLTHLCRSFFSAVIPIKNTSKTPSSSKLWITSISRCNCTSSSAPWKKPKRSV